jgi:hypothetical protein
MSQVFSTPNLLGNGSLADEQKTLPAGQPAAYVVILSVVMLFVTACVTWWACRFVSLELAAVFAEAFRKARLSEE